MTPAEASELRACMLESIPERLFETTVERRFIYIPVSHWKALDPDRSLVTGDRGTGKTFWWEALASDFGSRVLPLLFPQRSGVALTYKVSAGYGAKRLGEIDQPDQDALASLLEDLPERVVWKSIALARVEPSWAAGFSSWRERSRWVKDHPEDFSRLLAQVDDRLFAANQRHLIVFDAIDRAGASWADVARAHRGLFRLLLDLQGMRAIRAKAFIRRDILEDPDVLRFPDASKLKTSASELLWAPDDLYGLLWKYLGNATRFGAPFRSLVAGWRQQMEGWLVPRGLREADASRPLWHRLAGRWMGSNERKGDTYTWLTNHLSDAFGRVSPRSFLTAVREAAQSTREGESTAIHYTAIQNGVREASKIRAAEISEDFPWTQAALEALEELLVPCEEKAVLKAWEAAGLEKTLDRDAEARRRRRYGGSLAGVLDDLVDLGVVQRLRNGRINVPDVYRLGFGLRRKGGVPPKA